MFAIVGQRSSEAFCQHGSYTQTISFEPGTVHGQVALYHVAMYDEDLSHAKAWIGGYAHRPLPDGADESVLVAVPGGLTPSVVGVVERMIAITWGVKSAVAPQQGASPIVRGRLDIFWWADVSADRDVVDHERTVQLQPGVAAVVHDAHTGEIRHVHEEIVLSGIRPPDPIQVQRQAVALARSGAEGDLGDVRALIVSGDDVRVDRHLRVDVARQKLIARR
jgi:hypothetical protein